MSNVFAFPFDFNPASVSYKTSSYSVPAGQRARVTVTDFSADFTIDGTTVINQLVFDSSFALNSGAGEKVRNDSKYTLELTMDVVSYSSGSPVVGVFGPDANASGGANTCMYDETGTRAYYTVAGNINYAKVVIPPNGFIYLVTNGSNGTLHYMMTPKVTPPTVEFWVPTGTSLNGAGYQVELYDDIS